MNFARHAAITLVLFAAACPVLAADHFWNCTKPDGTKYADATQCDKGDSAVKVFKAGSDPAAAATGATPTPALVPAMADSRDTAVCPANTAYCTRASELSNDGKFDNSALMEEMGPLLRLCSLEKLMLLLPNLETFLR